MKGKDNEFESMKIDKLDEGGIWQVDNYIEVIPHVERQFVELPSGVLLLLLLSGNWLEKKRGWGF